MGLAAVVAIIFLMKTMKKYLDQIKGPYRVIALVVLLILQGLVYFSYKVTFF